jgi:hypothetical protein
MHVDKDYTAGSFMLKSPEYGRFTIGMIRAGFQIKKGSFKMKLPFVCECYKLFFPEVEYFLNPEDCVF